MNPNISNKRVWERLRSDPEWRAEAIRWLKRRKRNLQLRYKRKYKKSRSNISEVSTNP